MASFNGMSGFKNLVSNMTEEVLNETKELVKSTTLSVEADAKNLAPVDTGHLRRNIVSTMEDEFTGIVTSNSEYGMHVEFGSSKTPAQPYFMPAYDKHAKDFNKKMKKIVKG